MSSKIKRAVVAALAAAALAAGTMGAVVASSAYHGAPTHAVAMHYHG